MYLNSTRIQSFNSWEVRGWGGGGRKKFQKVGCLGGLVKKYFLTRQESGQELDVRKTFLFYLKWTLDCKILLEKWCQRERERERERDDRSQTADAHSNAQSPVYIWKTGLALFWSFVCCLGVYIDCVLIKIIFIFFLEILMFPLSACRCTADITHGSYSMEFF